MVGQAYKLLIFDDQEAWPASFYSTTRKYLKRGDIDLLPVFVWRGKSLTGMVGASLWITDFSRGVFTASCCGVSNVAR